MYAGRNAQLWVTFYATDSRKTIRAGRVSITVSKATPPSSGPRLLMCPLASRLVRSAQCLGSVRHIEYSPTPASCSRPDAYSVVTFNPKDKANYTTASDYSVTVAETVPRSIGLRRTNPYVRSRPPSSTPQLRSRAHLSTLQRPASCSRRIAYSVVTFTPVMERATQQRWRPCRSP